MHHVTDLRESRGLAHAYRQVRTVVMTTQVVARTGMHFRGLITNTMYQRGKYSTLRDISAPQALPQAWRNQTLYSIPNSVVFEASGEVVRSVQ